MARRYSGCAAPTNTASQTMMGITSAATIRPSLYEILISCGITPASQAAEYQVKRSTGAGTSTSLTPVAADPNDQGNNLASMGYAHSGEPTYTAARTCLQVSVNQQSTWRWITVPEDGILMPSTAANGLGLFTLSVTSAFATDVTLRYVE